MVGETLLRVGWAEVLLAVLAAAAIGMLVSRVTRATLGLRRSVGRVAVVAVAVAGGGLYAVVVGIVPAWVDDPDCEAEVLAAGGGGGSVVLARAEPAIPPGSTEEVAAATGAWPPVHLPGLETHGSVATTIDGGIELRIVAGSHHSVDELRRLATDAVVSIGAEVVAESSHSPDGSVGDRFSLTWRSEHGQGLLAASDCGVGPRDPARFVSTTAVGPARLGDCAAPGLLRVCEAIYAAADELAPVGVVDPAAGGSAGVRRVLSSVTTTEDGRLLLDQPPVPMLAGAVGAFGAADRALDGLVSLGWAPDPAEGVMLTRDVDGTPLRLTFAIDDLGSVTFRIETLVPVPAE